MIPRHVRALVLLTGALLRRLAREPIVLRSLAFPLVIGAGTLIATLGAATIFLGRHAIAVPEGFDASTVTSHRPDILVETSADPHGDVLSGEALAGTDGHTLWTRGEPATTVLLEAAIREHAGPFRIDPVADLPQQVNVGSGETIGRMLSTLFALYGVVFGAGMVARDRDDGSLDAELALPVPRWIPGLARWLVAAVGLGAVATASLLVFDALMGIPDLAAAGRIAIAASAGSTAVGLFTVRNASLKSGFGASLASGLVLTFGLLAVGTWTPYAAWLPIASITAGGAGWAPLALSIVAGGVAAFGFGRAVGR